MMEVNREIGEVHPDPSPRGLGLVIATIEDCTGEIRADEVAI